MKKLIVLLALACLLCTGIVAAAGLEDYVVGYWRFNDTSNDSGLKSYFDAYVPGPGLQIWGGTSGTPTVLSNSTLVTFAGPFGNGIRSSTNRIMLQTRRWDNRFAQGYYGNNYSVSQWLYMNSADSPGGSYLWSVGNLTSGNWFAAYASDYNGTSGYYENTTVQMKCMDAPLSFRNRTMSGWHLFTVAATLNKYNNWTLNFYVDNYTKGQVNVTGDCRIDTVAILTSTGSSSWPNVSDYAEWNFTVGGIQGMTNVNNLSYNMYGPTGLFVKVLNSSDVAELYNSSNYYNAIGKLNALPHYGVSNASLDVVTSYPMVTVVPVAIGNTSDTVPFFVSTFSNFSYLNQRMGDKRVEGTVVNQMQGGYTFYWNETIFNRWGSLTKNFNNTVSYDYVPSFIIGSEYPKNLSRARKLTSNSVSWVAWQRDGALGASLGIGLDDNNMTVELYFGETNPPPLYASFQLNSSSYGIANGSYALPALTAQHVYYWKAVMYDGLNKNTSVPMYPITRFESTQYCLEQDGCINRAYGIVNTTGVMKFSAPNELTSDAWAYWDFRNMSLNEFYSGTAGVNASAMVTSNATPFGNGTLGVGSALSIDSRIPNPVGYSYNWSYAGWMYVNSSLGTHTLWSMNDASTRYITMSFDSTQGLYLSCRNSGGGSGSFSSSLVSLANTPLNQWFFFGYVNNGTGNQWENSFVYVNNVSYTVNRVDRCKFDMLTSNVTFSPQAIGPTAFWTRSLPQSQMTEFYNNNSYYDWMSFNNPPTFTGDTSSWSPANNSLNATRNQSFSWTSGYDADGHTMSYFLMSGTSPTNLSNVTGALNSTSVNYTFPAERTTYYWTVRVQDQLGAYNDGPVYNLTTRNDPPYFVNVTPASNATDVAYAGGTLLSWVASDVGNESLTYDVWFGTNASNLTRLSAGQSAANYSSNLSAHTRYYWVVTAYDGNGGVTNSSVANFTTYNDVPVMQLLYPTNGTTGVAENFNVSWNASDAFNDTVYIDLYLNGSLIASNLTNVSSYALSLGRGTNYTLRLVASDLFGASNSTGDGWFVTRVDIAPTFLYYTPNSTHDGSIRQAMVSFNASNAYNDTITYSFGASMGFVWSQFAYTTTANRWILGYLGYGAHQNSIYNYNLYGISPFGAQTHAGGASQLYWPISYNAPVSAYANLNSSRNDNVYSDLDMLGWCRVTYDEYPASIGYQLYRNGVLNRTGDAAPELSVASSKLVSSGTDIELSSEIDTTDMVLAAGQNNGLAYTRCDWYAGSCTQTPLEAGYTTTVAHTMALRAGGDGKVLVVYTRAGEYLPRYYLCSPDGSSCSSGNLSSLSGTTHISVAQLQESGIKFYAIVGSDLKSVTCSDQMTSCSNVTTVVAGGFSGSDVVDYRVSPVGSGDLLAYTRGGSYGALSSVSEVSVAGRLSYGSPASSYEEYVAYVQSGVGKLTNGSKTVTFAASASNIDAKVLINRKVVVTYSTGSSTNMAVCENDLSSCYTVVIDAHGSSATAVEQNWNMQSIPAYVARVRSGQIYLDRLNDQVFTSNETYHVVTVPQSELVDGQNWTMYCNGYDNYYSDALPNSMYAGFQRSGSLINSSNKTVMLNANLPPNAPTVVSPLSGATNVTVGDTLFWSGTDPNVDPLTFDVYLGTSNNSMSLVASGLNVTNYTTTTLNGHTQYFWMVRATDDGNLSANSSVWNFTTLNRAPVVAVGTPSNASSIYVSQLTNVTINWSIVDPDGDIVTSNVYFGNTSSPTNVVNTTGSTYSISSVMTDRTYYWRIVGYDTYGNYSDSGVWNFYVVNRVPNAPSYNSPANGTETSVRPTLSWSASDPDGNSLQYTVFFGTDPNNLSSLVGTASTSVNVQSYAGVLNLSTTYYWYVRVSDTVNVTSGGVMNFHTGANDAPFAPIMYYPAASATGVQFTTDLAWAYGGDPNGDPVYFNVYFGNSPSNLSQVLVNGINSRNNLPRTYAFECNMASPDFGPGCNYMTQGGLTPLQTYYWRVDSTDLLGGTTGGTLRSFTVRANSAPTISLTSPNNGYTYPSFQAITMRWSGSQPEGDALTYDVWFGTNESNLSMIENGVSGTERSVSTGYLSQSTTYYWMVTVHAPYWPVEVNSTMRSFTTGSVPPPTPPAVVLPPGSSNPSTPIGSNPEIVIPIVLPPINNSNPNQTLDWQNVTCVFNGTYYNGTDSNNCSFIMTNCGSLELGNCGHLPPDCTNCSYEGNITPIVTDPNDGTIIEGPSTDIGVVNPSPDPDAPTTPPNDGGNVGGGDQVVPPPVNDCTLTGTCPPVNDCQLLGTCDPAGNGTGGGGTGSGNNTVTYDLYEGHNQLWVLEIQPDALTPSGGGPVALGSIYGCDSNAARAKCAGINGVMVANMRREIVNGENFTVEEFACYDPSTMEKVSSMTISKNICPYEIYTTDTNGDGVSDVVTYDGVYDVSHSVRTKVLSGSGPYDAMLPVDVKSTGNLGFVFTQRGGGSQIGVYGVGGSSGGGGGGGGTIPTGRFTVSYNKQRMNLLINILSVKLPYVTYQVDVWKFNDQGVASLFDTVNSAQQEIETTPDIYTKGLYQIDVTQTDAITGALRFRSVNYTIDDDSSASPPDILAKCRVREEFRYSDPVTNHGWVSDVDKNGVPMNPVLDGEGAFVSNGVQIERTIKDGCDRKQYSVETLIAPSDFANYSVSLNVYGTTGSASPQKVLVGGFTVVDEGSYNGQNLFVNDRDYVGLLKSLRPVGSLPTSSDLIIATLTLNVDSKQIDLKTGSVYVADSGMKVKINGLSTTQVKFELQYGSDGLITNVTNVGESNTYTVGGKSIVLNPLSVALNSADYSKMKFSRVKMVFDLDSQVYTLWVDGLQQGGSTSFANTVNSIASIAIESRTSSVVSYGAQAVFDYVYAQGDGGKFERAKQITEEQQAHVAALQLLGNVGDHDEFGNGCDPNVDLSLLRDPNVTRKIQTYSTVALYCSKLYEGGLSASTTCSIEALKDALSYNRDCYKEAFGYCRDITFAKTGGLTHAPSEFAEDMPQDSSLDGSAGCSAALTITSATTTVMRPVWNSLWFMFRSNLVPILVVGLLIALFIAGGGRRR